jgi:hypothetical protein
MESHSQLHALMAVVYKNFRVYCLIWAESGIGDVYVMLLSISQVHKNWQRDRHAFITSINETMNKITHMRYDVLTAVSLKIQVLWVAMPRHQGRRFQGFKGRTAFICMGEKMQQKSLQYQESLAQRHGITSQRM